MLFDMENHILHLIDFKLLIPLPIEILEMIKLVNISHDPKIIMFWSLSEYILTKSLMDDFFNQYNPCELCTGVILLSNKIFNVFSE